MKQHLKKIVRWVAIYVFMLIGVFVFNNHVSAASNGLTVSPMNQSIVLMPGESYDATFIISNPVNSSGDTYYELSVEPFYLNDKSEAVFEEFSDSNKMVDWITFISPEEGVLAPNETKEIKFTIDVPKDAPAGGQYASIAIAMKKDEPNKDNENSNNGKDSQAMIKEIQRVGHLVYAEVAGNTVKKGEIIDASVPSFLLSGDIKGVSFVKNTGNVHGNAKYTLQVYPLFSDEEIYTNEEDPATQIIFPERTVYNETAWEQTPTIGIFNVIYTVEFEGATTQVSKMVIICPIWLLFIILFVIAAIIIWIIMRVKTHSKKKSRKAPIAQEAAE